MLLCTIVIGDDWGGVFNGTGLGQIGAVFDQEVEFAIGCIYKWFDEYFYFFL